MSKRFNAYDEFREKFYRLPKVFFTNEKYKNMSNDAKMAWAILQDRLELSQENGWIDRNGDYYFKYSNKNLQEILNCGHTKLNKTKKELENAELLEQFQQGLNKSNILYLNKPAVNDNDIYEISQSENKKANDKPNEIKDFRKTETRTSAKRKSGLPQNGNQDFRKTETNQTYSSETESNDTEYLSINQEHIDSLSIPTSTKIQMTKNIDRLIDDNISLSDIETLYNSFKDTVNDFTFSFILGNVLGKTKGKINDISNLMNVSVYNHLKQLPKSDNKTTQENKEVIPDWFNENKEQATPKKDDEKKELSAEERQELEDILKRHSSRKTS